MKTKQDKTRQDKTQRDYFHIVIIMLRMIIFLPVGVAVGLAVGSSVESWVGFKVGSSIGVRVGLNDGIAVVGDEVGSPGLADGLSVSAQYM
jgi:hypothetical protein